VKLNGTVVEEVGVSNYDFQPTEIRLQGLAKKGLAKEQNMITFELLTTAIQSRKG
jgi:hypothetical protein